MTELLQLDRTTIYRMLSDGRLPAVRIGSQWRFSRPEIASLLQTQNLPGPSSLRADVPSLHYLDSIQRVFAESANIGSVTTDLSGRPIATFRNSCAFCNLILASPSGRARCQASWRELAEQTGPQPHAEVCHAGLTYACAPITVQGKRIAIIFVGQFAVRERSCVDSGEHLARVASACAVDGDELRKATLEIPVLGEKRVEQLLRLLQMLANTFSALEQERHDLLARLRRVAEIARVVQP